MLFGFGCCVGFALLIALNRIIDLSTVNWDALWGSDAEADFVASDVDDCDFNIVADHY